MDHALRTISYIADIGDLLVLMARRRAMAGQEEEHKIKRTPKMICHVFESEEAQFIAQSIGQAFQGDNGANCGDDCVTLSSAVAYMEFLKANGIEDSGFVKEMDYQEVLNSQEIFGDELDMFANKNRQKDIIVPKQKGEILGMRLRDRCASSCNSPYSHTQAWSWSRVAGVRCCRRWSSPTWLTDHRHPDAAR